MKTAKLTSAQLDCWVAKAEGKYLNADGKEWDWCSEVDGGLRFYSIPVDEYTPSTNWAQGGPIIDRERILTCSPHDDAPPDRMWQAVPNKQIQTYWGATPLIAAMRAFVASRLGDKVDE